MRLSPAVLLLLVFQSPLTHTSTGSPISPLQVLARQMRIDEQKGHQQNGLLSVAVRALLLPGNVVKVLASSNATISELDISLVCTRA